jgi:hypothetical protein
MARRGRPLGLDELMIVNPGPSDSVAFFLGADGTLYEVRGVDHDEVGAERRQLFLGADDSLYQVRGLDGDGRSRLGCLFLTDDGTLYGVVR